MRKKTYLSRMEVADTESGLKEITTLDDMASYAASTAKELAQVNLIINRSKK